MIDNNQILKFVKFNLGISTSVRDDYLNFLIESTIAREKRAGVDPEGQSEDYQSEYFSYIVDEVAQMYRNRGGEIGRPYGFTHRRNTLIMEKEDVE